MIVAAGDRVNPPRARAAVASVIDLRVHFRSKAGVVHAVDGVSFDIRGGETLGLVGETGCGKTVTARSFLGLVPIPPGIMAGGSILFWPHHTCPSCGGAGCENCRGDGRVPDPCRHCEGAGCERCRESGAREVDLLDVPETEMRNIRGDRIAMVFQDPGKALNPALSIGEQVAEVFYQHRSDELLADAGVDESDRGVATFLIRRKARLLSRRPEDLVLSVPPLRGKRNELRRVTRARVADVLAETQIPNPVKVMDRYPHELSGGMRQRVMIAQALACDPDLLIADEPTTALDVTVQARILDLVRELQERHQTSVLYISHDLSLVSRVCDRVAVMYAGRIVETAPTDVLFRDPRHPYTRGLLTAIPGTSHERGKLVGISGTVPELIDPPEMCRFAGRCPYEAELCRTADPVPASVGEGHEVACFIHDAPEGASGVPTFEQRVR